MTEAQEAIDKVRGPNKGPENLYELIKRDQKRIQKALPSHLDAERFVAIACNAVRSGKKLMECTAGSVRLAILESAQLGLELDGVLGHAYLIPRKNKYTKNLEAEFQIGYRGLILLAERSAGATINANVVYPNDLWDFCEGTEPFIRHKRALNDRGEHPIAAWCVATKRDGGQTFRILGEADIDRAKKSSTSASGSFSPWKTHEDAMWQKTAIRATLKWLPLGHTDMRAVMNDELRAEGVVTPPLGVAEDSTIDVVDATTGEVLEEGES